MDMLKSFVVVFLRYIPPVKSWKFCSLQVGNSEKGVSTIQKISLGRFLWFNSSRPIEAARPAIRPLIIFLLGAPGVGKGTVSKFLKDAFPGLTHLSYGDLVRYQDDIPGSWISSFPRREGASSPLLPARVSAKLIQETIETGVSRYGQMTWLIDGFPRTAQHVAEWMAHMPSADLTLHMFCPPAVSIERVLGRAQNSKRPDDADMQKVENRVNRNVAESQSMLDALEGCGTQVVRVDANRDLELVKTDIFNHVKGAMKSWEEKTHKS
ncbi:P-loop containing nucleoside triphosphate hydrolase protein [Hypoxylon fragiforme]|uniref:P-loop containing nucleoside triphosphate hydrolase protein n=1 Tax=Hypoxylon fragiforme TaxID=63214 RepID=UPI0020C688DE|nr:P-loop containing nucleoside triphosphate hydrolase protein [Hypoxylon fragiforme]KAI2605005.1 P-loop containing nucleoside triphosphate hydrolase protein [Hypoxylon fragiforme]